MSVVGFLTALLIPSLKRSTDLAAATVCRHHLRALGQSLDMYRYENDGWLPSSEPNAGGRRHVAEPWFGKLYPTYLGDPLVLRCPRDPYGFRLAAFSSRIREPVVADFASYGLNNFILTVNGGMLANLDRHSARRPLDTILSADMGPDDGLPGKRGEPISGPTRNDSLLMWGDGFDPFSDTPAGSWLTTRHGVGIHVLTVGGGVRDVRTTQLLRSPIARYYPNCAGGGCTLCTDTRLFHYSFAKDQLFWWTGSIPSP